MCVEWSLLGCCTHCEEWISACHHWRSGDIVLLVCWFLSSCMWHEELGMKALLHFVQILGFVFSSTWFIWASCVSWFRFPINCWWKIWRMVNNRALRSSMPSIHLSSYICYKLGGIHSINSWHRLLYRRCYEHISEYFRTCSADLFSYATCASSIWRGVKVVWVVVHVDSSVYLHPDLD